jgi:hypothetical protein
MKVLNGYIGIMPTLKDSASAVASTGKGNIPFNNSRLIWLGLSWPPAPLCGGTSTL